VNLLKEKKLLTSADWEEHAVFFQVFQTERWQLMSVVRRGIPDDLGALGRVLSLEHSGPRQESEAIPLSFSVSKAFAS
jgi:hypothetical protein